VSVEPRCRASARALFAVVLGVVLLCVALGGGRPSPPSAPLLLENAPSQCPGALQTHNYSGNVVVDGSAPIPSVTVAYSYDAVVTTQIVGNSSTTSVCTPEQGTAVSNSSGAFQFGIDPAPAQQCTPLPSGLRVCTYTYGPYGPVNLTLTSPNPPGYLSSVTQDGAVFQVAYYPGLATVALDPPGPSVTYTANAVDEVRAEAFTGNGSPTPFHPRFDWTLSGVGWTFSAPPDGSVVNVTAAPGAAVGNLTVVASLGASAGGLVAPPQGIELLAVATTIPSASLNRTVVDVGQPLSVALNGSGAAGYNYTATVDPGLGESPTSAACRASASGDSTVALSCSASLTYYSVGAAQPVVTLSNGPSSAVWAFPQVTVDPNPLIDFLPDTPLGYANATLPVTVAVSPGTGAAPYAEACLAAGNGPLRCSSSPGPTWTFEPVYSRPGNYSALAWVVDATGVNRSVTTTVRVVAPLELAPAVFPATASAGVPIALSGIVSGGDLPARVWWNATGASDPVGSAWVIADGPVDATFVPLAAGFVTVSVVVVDGLGTVVRSSETMTVGVGPATSVAPVLLPAASGSHAGEPLGLSWEALDPVDEVVRSFASPAEIELTVDGSDASVPGWVNASGAGPLLSPLPGWFDVPSGAWIDGTLNVTVTTALAGSLDIALHVAVGLPGGVDTVAVAVLPDVEHLRLFDPRTVDPDGGNDTLWQVTDEFGNAAEGSSIVVTSSFGAATSRTVVPVVPETGGRTAVWVNVTDTGSLGGTVTVTDLAGDLLLPPIDVAAPAGPLATPVPLAPLLLGVGVGVASSAISVRRTRRPRPADEDEAANPEQALQRLAEGRATVVEGVRRAGSVDLAGLESGWTPSPAPPDLADWVASLVTDGTLGATLGADGVARFCLAPEEAPGAKVTVDVEAFDRGQVRRHEATADWERDEP
jgi:hypothetical protein